MRKTGFTILCLLSTVFLIALAFNVQPVKASGTVYIRSDGRVFPSDAPIHRDGNIYTLTGDINDSIVIQRDNLTLDGQGFYHFEGPGDYNSIGMNLTKRKNITIKNLEIKSFGYGIILNVSSNIILSELTVKENNAGGVNLFDASNINITENHFFANGNHDIRLHDSSDNTICHSEFGRILVTYDSTQNTIGKNHISNTGQQGIGFSYSSNNNWVYDNVITGSGLYGIKIFQASDQRICRNNITHQQYGIYMDHASSNTIAGNNIANNSVAGIFLHDSSSNTIFHNNLIENLNHALTYESHLNLWDDGYPSGGNYWSNHTGIDSPPRDGIGNISYILDAENQDNYPLMAPIHFFNASLWNNKTQLVSIFSNSTISSFHAEPNQSITHIRFNVTGLNGTVGFCRVGFSKTILPPPYIVTVNGKEVIPYGTSNNTHVFLYFEYNHSTQTVKIIPEFPSLLILSLVMIATLSVAILHRRKDEH